MLDLGVGFYCLRDYVAGAYLYEREDVFVVSTG